MADWTFHPTLVAPFYLQLMNASILGMPSEERADLLAEFRARANEVTDREILEMLRSSWRPAKVAAWFIAYLELPQFAEEVATRLLSQPWYSEHFCFCLARLGGEPARRALMGYLQGCAEGTLQKETWDETINPEYALIALEYLDRGHTAPLAHSFWIKFLERHDHDGNRPVRLRESFEQRLICGREVFDAVMILFDNGLESEPLYER